MQKNENPQEYLYPIRDLDDPTHVTLVPISEEIYRELYPEIWRTRKRMQRSGKCFCPKDKLWVCDGDCLSCRYQGFGEELYLSTPIPETDGLEYSDVITDERSIPDDILMDQLLLEHLYTVLEELDPVERQMCELMKDHSERETAALMGMVRTTFRYRWKKLQALLQKKLKEYYY